jgi:hypothetical protein
MVAYSSAQKEIANILSAYEDVEAVYILEKLKLQYLGVNFEEFSKLK